MGTTRPRGAAALPRLVRRALLGAAVALVAAAGLYGRLAEDCSTTRAEVTAAAGDSEERTQTCAPPSATSVPVVALLVLAGLCLSPWVKRLTVGPVTAERDETQAPRQSALALRRAGDDGGSGADAGRARVAQLFVEGTDLPPPWERATLLFVQPTAAGPDIVFTRRRQRGRRLDVAAPVAPDDLVVATSAAVRDPEGVALAGGRTTVAAAAGRNAAGRCVGVVAAVLDAPQADLPEDVAATLVDLAEAWARVLVDVLLQDDDGA